MHYNPLALAVLLVGIPLAGCADDGRAAEGGDGTGDDGPVGNQTTDRQLPAALNFTFGPTLACESSLTPLECVSFLAGPDAPPVDGHWILLGPLYEGLNFTSTIDVADGSNDSDCYFVNDMAQVTGNANNAANPCSGEVPEGTAYLFLYPYLAPASAMTLTFAPPE